jgi:hypothetical protein
MAKLKAKAIHPQAASGLATHIVRRQSLAAEVVHRQSLAAEVVRRQSLAAEVVRRQSLAAGPLTPIQLPQTFRTIQTKSNTKQNTDNKKIHPQAASGLATHIVRHQSLAVGALIRNSGNVKWPIHGRTGKQMYWNSAIIKDSVLLYATTYLLLEYDHATKRFGSSELPCFLD